MAGIERVCISVNSACDLRCSYCYFFLAPERLPGSVALSKEEIAVILANADRYGRRPEVDKRIKVNFVGSGEPLLAWQSIRAAIEASAPPSGHRLRFYMVTNGLLLTPRIAQEMKSVGLSPSVSLDGPADIHDGGRSGPSGRGSHAQVVRGIEALRKAGVPIAVNTTLTRPVMENLERVLDYFDEQKFAKVIFGRLVDVPPEQAASDDQFYEALRKIVQIVERKRLGLEIGNIEAYRRALTGEPDRVCTMFGSTCGAGLSNIIYMQRDVYPCGRMFGQERWLLGRWDEPLENFPARMRQVLEGLEESVPARPDAACPDCLLDRQSRNYDARPRREFVRWLGERIRLAGKQ